MYKLRKQLCFFLILPFVIFSIWACAPPASNVPLPEHWTSQAPPVPAQPALTPLQPTPLETPPGQPVLPLEPTPVVTLAGSTLENGPFTFYLFLYSDPSVGKEPVAPSLYSDLNGTGAYMFWVYNGPDLAGPVEEFWGTQPTLNLLNTYPEIRTGQSGGRSGGIFLPGGPFVPGESQAGDQVELALQLKTVSGSYGASISFILEDTASGFGPAAITIGPLDGVPAEPSPESGTTAWAEVWSSLEPVSVLASSYSLAGEHATYTDSRGFSIDYPAGWSLNNQGGLLQLASFDLFQSGHGGVTLYEAKLDILVLPQPGAWTMMDEINALQQSSTGRLVEMQNLLLADGTPAARLVLSGELGESRVFLTLMHGLSIRIFGYGNAHMIDAITSTIRSF